MNLFLVIDSSGKMTSGMLHGNINQLGDFDACTGIRTIVKVTKDLPIKVKGKYCLAHIEFRAKEDGLRFPIHLAHGRGLWNSHLGNVRFYISRLHVLFEIFFILHDLWQLWDYEHYFRAYLKASSSICPFVNIFNPILQGLPP